MKYRIEFDSIGKIKVPGDKYWGASTERSNKYFNIGDFLVRPLVIHSIAIIKKAADDVLKELNVVDPVLEIAKKLEKVALEDEYFKSRNLYPNVDFYSGIIYRALGIPTDMFTVMFALGRLPGWIAQWKEMRENHEPIGRPRQVYTGANARTYVNIENR